jgi:hypothetical protein
MFKISQRFFFDYRSIVIIGGESKNVKALRIKWGEGEGGGYAGKPARWGFESLRPRPGRLKGPIYHEAETLSRLFTDGG